jgi:hypothetical protein
MIRRVMISRVKRQPLLMLKMNYKNSEHNKPAIRKNSNIKELLMKDIEEKT